MREMMEHRLRPVRARTSDTAHTVSHTVAQPPGVGVRLRGARQGRWHGHTTVSPPGPGAAQHAPQLLPSSRWAPGPWAGARRFQERSPNFKSFKVLPISKNQSLLALTL